MDRRTALAFVFSAGCGGIVLYATGGGIPQSSGQSKRLRVPYQEGRSLATLAAPPVEEVEVYLEQSLPFGSIPPPGMSLVEWKTRLLGWAAVVSVTSRKSTLTQSEDWIETLIDAQVVAVLKNTPSASLTPHTRIHFTEQGGQVSHGPIQIRGLVPWARPLRAGARYIVFGGIAGTGHLQVSPMDVYEVQDGSLSRMTVEGADAISKADFVTVTKEIRSKAKLPHPR